MEEGCQRILWNRLSGLAGARRSNPFKADLARLCGSLPLALRIAAGYLTTYPDWSLPDYLDALRSKPLDYLTVADDDVRKVLNLSYETLQRDDPALSAAWQALAIFPAPFDRAAAAAVLDAPEP